MAKYFKNALLMLIFLAILTGVIYPLVITGISQLFFAKQANGSLILNAKNEPVGSALIGQNFTAPKYFWGRLSATTPYPYNGTASTPSNLSVTNPAWVAQVKARIAALKAADPTNTKPIPVDLVTASGSGLDPDITLAAALYQAPRIARLRHLPLATVEKIIADNTTHRAFGFLGEEYVNVLQMNLALDQVSFTK